mmetsp:Transcript_3879/g.8744  ORF Transcript_3879/g.8744 Transcript_3879/m.8744 type:complete len:866 (+) Transcript_3879:2850-5447(+)
MRKNIFYITLVQFVASYVLHVSALAQNSSALHLPKYTDKTPQHYLIEDIHIIGTASLDKEAVIAFLGLKSGDKIQLPGPVIADAIQRLWQQRLVKEVAIYASPAPKGTERHIVLTVHITEMPRLSTYAFEGIKNRVQKKLVDKINLKRGKIVTDELLQSTQQILQDYWLEKGYLNAKVAITSFPDPTCPGYVQLKINIDKRKRLRVYTVNFLGNKSIASSVLRSQMKQIREKPRFTLVKDLLYHVCALQPIRKGGVLWYPINLKKSWDYLQEHVILFPSEFSQTKLEKDKKNILHYYQSQGFRDAAIVTGTVSKRKDAALLNVEIQVEEGPRYRVGDIKWVGNHLHDERMLNRRLNIKKGDVYNPKLLQKQLYNNPNGLDVASLYMDDGYLFFQADPVEMKVSENIVDLKIGIQEGPQTYINEVLIEGNTLTYDHVIRRELRTLPGDKFNRAKLQRSYRELAQLNIFDPAIDITPIPNFRDRNVDLKYRVKEKPQCEFKFSGSWGNSGFMGGITLATNNFSLGNFWKSRLPMGGAQTLGIKAEIDERGYKNVALEFTEPWLGGQKPRLFHLSLNMASEKNRTSIGGTTGLGTRLSWPDDYTFLTSKLSYHKHRYVDYDLLDHQKEDTGILNDLAVRISLIRDSTGPDPIYPREGIRVALHTHLTPPWSLFSVGQRSRSDGMEPYRWKEYHQWMLDGSYFLQLLEDLVLNIRSNFGVLGKFFSQEKIGPFERFYLGGTSFMEYSIRGKECIPLRGYEEDYFTPKDNVSGYKGGIIYDKFVLELRYPIISTYIATAYVLAFAEGGNTWKSYKNFNLLDVKRSVGVGVRVHLPFLIGGLVGFDWGYGFDKTPTDKENNRLSFHFAIGV